MSPMVQSDLGPYCLQYRLPKKISRKIHGYHLKGEANLQAFLLSGSISFVP